MKCPYQTIVIHKPEYTEGYVKHFAKDITEFGDCVKAECPFYYTTGANIIIEKCRKADTEGTPSPSGKAQGFDPCIRRFESGRG